jgi:hypothetical protein
MVAWPVSPRIGNVKNNDASLIEPIAGAGSPRWIRWPDELAQTARHAPHMLALTACAQGGHVPYAPENMHDRGGDGGGGMM